MQYLTSNKSTENGYRYRVHLLWNRKPELVQITPKHVYIVWDEKATPVRCKGGLVRPFSCANLIPERMFPHSESLTQEQIGRIIKILEDTNFESFEVN